MIDSIILQWLIARIVDLWSDSAGRIFLLTALTYFFAYIFYAGYLSRFGGGIGSLAFNISDFSIADLLSILPLSLITLFQFLFRFLKSLLNPLLLLFVPAMLSAIIFVVFQQPAINISPLLILICFLIWLLLPIYTANKKYKMLSFQYVLSFIVSSISFFLLLGITKASIGLIDIQPVQFQESWSLPLLTLVTRIGNEIFVILLIINIVLFPFVAGTAAADKTVKDHRLSHVYRLTLEKPISIPTNYRKISLKKRRNWERGFLLARSSLQINIEPDVYTYAYRPGSLPLYLVTSLRKFTLFYVPSDINEEIVMGHLISISNEMIHSIEIQNRKLN